MVHRSAWSQLGQIHSVSRLTTRTFEVGQNACLRSRLKWGIWSACHRVTTSREPTPIVYLLLSVRSWYRPAPGGSGRVSLEDLLDTGQHPRREDRSQAPGRRLSLNRSRGNGLPSSPQPSGGLQLQELRLLPFPLDPHTVLLRGHSCSSIPHLPNMCKALWFVSSSPTLWRLRLPLPHSVAFNKHLGFEVDLHGFESWPCHVVRPSVSVERR